jgi:hypothetical protein
MGDINLAQGYGAGGAGAGLQELIANRLMRDKLNEAIRAQQAQEEGQAQTESRQAAAQKFQQDFAQRQLQQRNLDAINAGAVHRQEFDTETGLKKQQLGQAASEAELRANLENERMGLETQQIGEAGRHNRAMEGLEGARINAGTTNKTVKITYQDPETGGVVEEYVTPAEAKARGKMTAPPKGGGLSASAKEDIATMATVQDLSKQALALGDKLQWSGVGGFGKGSVQQFFAKNMGTGSPESENLRNQIGNIEGTIAKLRGGTAFTPNEQRLLESYTPTINDSPLVIKSKLAQLDTFIESKRKNTLAAAQMGTAGGGIMSSHAPTAGASSGGGEFDFVPGKGLVARTP